MERTDTTDGKYYARVEITSEQRLVYVGGQSWQERLARAKEVFNTLRQSLDRAKEFVENGFTASERKLGDTLKEYADKVKTAYEDIRKLTAGMKFMTGSITQKQFDDVNKLIDSYNKYQGVVDNYRSSVPGTKLASVPALPRVKAGDLRAKILPDTAKSESRPGQMGPGKPRPDPITPPVQATKEVVLAGSSFAGSETLGGYGRLRFSFRAGGGATMYDTDGAQNGTWEQRGNRVTLRFYSGSVVYEGTLTGRTLAGTARNASVSWAWSLTRE
jgi:hypothetical protein